MSDLIIKIGDESLDLKSGEVIAITKQAAKVGDFSRVLADGTNEVTIPLTAHNIDTLENAHLLQTDSEKPYRRLPATLIQEGYETLQDAFAEIKNSNQNFSLQVIGGNASFFNLIKDLNLRDLDLSEYDHFWTNLNVFTNRNTTEGFIYALFEQSDNALDPTLSTYGTNLYAVQTEKLLPLFFDATLIEKIFEEQTGWTFDCDLIGSFIWDNSTVFKGENWNRGTDSSYLNLETAGTVDVDLVYNGIVGSSIPSPLIEDGQITSQETIYWNETTLNSLLLTGRISHTGDLFETYGSVLLLPDATRLQVTFTLVIENPNGVDHNIFVGCAYTSDAGDLFVNLPAYVAPPGTTTETFTFDIDITKTLSQTGYFFAGENGAFFTIYQQPSSGSGDITIKAASAAVFAFEFISAYDITTTVPYNFLRGFTPVPDMKQVDYLKDISKKFQLIYDVDEVTHTVTARRFDEIKNNIPNAIDFSDKLAENKEQNIEYQIAGYAQTNYLKWKEDDITKYTAQGIISVDDQTLEAEKDVVEMGQFAATSPVTRFDTKQVPYVPLFTEGLPTNGMTDRMLLVRRETFAYNINFNRSTETPTDYPTDDVTFAYFAEAGNEDSLDFPTLITRFYQAINDMLFRAKSITCYVNLKIKDVVNYNPFIPVYFAKWNNYFYWEKLENYVKSKLTKIKIIKL